MNHLQKLESVLSECPKLFDNPARETLIKEVLEKKEALVSANGALATWTPPESTGRSPKDTVIVKRAESEETIDWDSPNNIPISEDTFDMVVEDALGLLSTKSKIYMTDKVVGAETSYALPTKTVTDWALTALFTDNMFRPVPEDIEKSIFADRGFTLVTLPYDKLDSAKYEGRLRTLPSGEASNMIVAMDFDRRLGVIIGSAYGGSVKKLMFTVMNFYLPSEGILPIHCSASEGPDGNSALLLGLSGTGKTTLSADPRRALLGDDEHGWGEQGIANFENGCYAKLIDLSKEEEPEIWNAVMHEDHYLNHGAIVENALMYPDGRFDFCDRRLTPNSRGSYPLSYLSNIKESSKSGHPNTILFLTADANGVLPPVSKLNPDQAMLWFLMGYTSKLAGTETGVTEPKTVFSRFFGEPFMPRNPNVYAEMLGKKMEKHGTKVYLINTGWTGGPYGTGERIDLKWTRAMVHAALKGDLMDAEYEKDRIFHLDIPTTCPDVPSEILFPKNTWNDKGAYEKRAAKLAGEFAEHFSQAYGDKEVDEKIASECPGR